MNPTKLFISYARVDEVRVADLVDILRSGGIEPWWDDRLEPGDDWKEALRGRIASCDGFVCVLSPDSVESEWCQWELAQASALSRPIIPVLIRTGTPLPPALARLHYLDATAGIEASVAARLVGRLARLGQRYSPAEAQLRRVPSGVPARLNRPLPNDYRTLAQAYFQPFVRGMSLYQWPEEAGESQSRHTILGIDFGTTESSVAIYDDGVATLIPNQFGDTSTISAVAIAGDGTPLIGAEAVELLLSRPERGILEVKRLLGVESAESPDVIVIDGIAYTAVQLAAFLFRQLRRDAEAYLNTRVTAVVLAAPAYFDPNQFAALTQAASLAGLDVVRVLSEPVAACMGAEPDLKSVEDKTWMVYDLGGGTFDASIVKFGQGVFEVKAVNGNTHLGGADFDRVLVDYCLTEFCKTTGLDMGDDFPALMRIRASAERAKIALSHLSDTAVRVPALALTDKGPLDLHVRLSKTRCTELTQHLTAETLRLTREVLADAGESATSIDNALIVGRASRAAGVSVALEDLFSPRLLRAPDNVVALGAAMQGAVLSGLAKDVLLLESTTRTLRVEIEKGQATPIIVRNTTIPTRHTLTLVPQGDAPGRSVIRIVAGESSWAARNLILAEVPIPEEPSGTVTWPWDLALDIDVNSLVRVTIRGADAKDLGESVFALRQTRKQTPSPRGRGSSPGTTNMPRLAEAIGLSPISRDTRTSRVRLRRWLCRAATDLVLARVGPWAWGGWWKALGDWLVQHPDEDVPVQFSTAVVFDIFSFERELLVDALEQSLQEDLQSVRHSSSIEALAEALTALTARPEEALTASLTKQCSGPAEPAADC